MPTVAFKIDPELCGPASIGTVQHVKVIREHLGLGLGDAKALVDRAVFGGETVSVDVSTDEAADALAQALRNISGPAVTEAFVKP